MNSELSSRDKSIRNFASRFCLAAGMPFGAWGYEIGGWWLVAVGVAFTLIVAVLAMGLDVWEDVKRASD